MSRIAVIVLLTVSAMVACSGNGDSGGPEEVDAFEGELPISAPWLRAQMPAEVLGYQRIPHPLALLAMPKGNVLDAALGSDANIRNLISVQQALGDNLAAAPAAFRNPAVTLFLDHLRSPVEIIVTDLPAPSALIGATLDASAAELEALIGQISAQLPVPITLAAPLDADGFGQLAGLPLPVFLYFDATSGRLAIHGGQFATREGFEALLAPPETAGEHAMHALEAEIDASGQGYFSWVDTARMLQSGVVPLPPEVFQMLQATGFAGMRSAAIGAGVANGKGRLKLAFDLGTGGGTSRIFPVVDNRIGAMSAGEPRSLFLLSIPSADEFRRLESLVLGMQPPSARNAWDEIKQALNAASNTSIEELLSAIGPEVMAVSDQAGDYVALKVRDRALLDDVLGRLSTSSGIAINERAVGGQSIRHIALPGNMGLPLEAIADAGALGMGTLLSRIRSRIYWVTDGDYIYLAGVPQILIDRARLGADTSIASWLAETQRVDLSSSFVAATGTLPRVPDLSYQAYLGTMQVIADLLDVEYDIFAMPTADQLGLPERSTLGLSLNFGDPAVSLEMTYESHPFEPLYGLGGMGAATAGILAAIAIPAYQDYTIRAQVAEGMNLAAAAKAAVAETWLNTGSAPTDRTAAGMTSNPRDTQGRYVQAIDIVGGQIVIEYGNAAHPQIANRTLVQTPYATPDGSVLWVCGFQEPPATLEPLGGTPASTSIQMQYLPSACRF